ncbi:MAG: IGR protein motif domain-containing protein [archaeon]|nr:IGR protein motif domain-containing protein [archaeon]
MQVFLARSLHFARVLGPSSQSSSLTRLQHAGSRGLFSSSAVLSARDGEREGDQGEEQGQEPEPELDSEDEEEEEKERFASKFLEESESVFKPFDVFLNQLSNREGRSLDQIEEQVLSSFQTQQDEACAEDPQLARRPLSSMDDYNKAMVEIFKSHYLRPLRQKKRDGTLTPEEAEELATMQAMDFDQLMQGEDNEEARLLIEDAIAQEEGGAEFADGDEDDDDDAAEEVADFSIEEVQGPPVDPEEAARLKAEDQQKLVTFLAALQRNMGQYAKKFSGFQELLSANTAVMREKGIPVVDRKYIYEWREKYRRGWFFPGDPTRSVYEPHDKIVRPKVMMKHRKKKMEKARESMVK